MSFERVAASAGSGMSSISARRHPTEPQCQNACRAFPVSHVETGCASGIPMHDCLPDYRKIRKYNKLNLSFMAAEMHHNSSALTPTDMSMYTTEA